MPKPYRVLDLTDYQGFLCGKILADLGAEVIKIEPPGGDPARRRGPFYHGEVNPERNLYWWAYSSGKKSITLDLDAGESKEVFQELVRNSSIIIESSPDGQIGKCGGYSDIARIAPHLVWTSISPFGRSGPYKEYRASHIDCVAMSGLMYIIGDTDRPPVQIPYPLVFCQASSLAASATLIAYYHSLHTGIGQHVDISMVSSLLPWCLNTIPIMQMEGKITKREGQLRFGRLKSGADIRYIWPCKDGFVAFNIGGGGSMYPMMLGSLVRWMGEEDMTTDYLNNVDWRKLDMAQLSEEDVRKIETPISRFFQSHYKKELYEQAIARRIMIYPVNTFKDIAQDPQLEHRGFWGKMFNADTGFSYPYPRHFAGSAQRAATDRFAPTVGEHNLDIYRGLLGYSDKKIAYLKGKGII